MTGTTVGSAGCYVYGLVRDDGTPLPDITGIGRSRLQLVRANDGDIAAVVSDAGALGERVRRADLLAHADVLQALVGERDVVPIRFGSVYRSDDDLCRGLLSGRLHDLFANIEGKIEAQVKVAYEEDAIVAEIVAADRRVRKMRDVTRSLPADRGAQIELGRRFAAALDGQRARDTQLIARRLGRVSETVTVSPGSGEFGVAKIACLTSRKKLTQLDEAIDGLAREHSGRLKLAVLCPLPPYSFVAGSLAEAG